MGLAFIQPEQILNQVIEEVRSIDPDNTYQAESIQTAGDRRYANTEDFKGAELRVQLLFSAYQTLIQSGIMGDGMWNEHHDFLQSCIESIPEAHIRVQYWVTYAVTCNMFMQMRGQVERGKMREIAQLEGKFGFPPPGIGGGHA